MIQAFWYKSKNVGDTLTPIIVNFFTEQKVLFAKRNVRGKLIAVGSVMKALRVGDTVWGTGIMRSYDKFPQAKQCKILAVRGKLTEKILGVECGVYGDPALLLPLIYNPKIEKKYQIGYVPHYVDKIHFEGWKSETSQVIDVFLPWKEFIDKILECDRVVSSSLHGIIIAEAYGIPATWETYSDKVLGQGFKFKDYLTGTGREIQEPGEFPPIENLKEIQDKLIKVLNKHYGK